MEKRTECGNSGSSMQELEDAFGGEVRGVDLAVSLERRCAAQTAPSTPGTRCSSGRSVRMHAPISLRGMPQAGMAVAVARSMIAADLDEVPALAVAHGRIGDALELVHGFHHLPAGKPRGASLLPSSAMVPCIALMLELRPCQLRDRGEFSRCHCSVEICSRTWREFSRAHDDAARAPRIYFPYRR